MQDLKTSIQLDFLLQGVHSFLCRVNNPAETSDDDDDEGTTLIATPSTSSQGNRRPSSIFCVTP
jgi:hypothetical protein